MGVIQLRGNSNSILQGHHVLQHTYNQEKEAGTVSRVLTSSLTSEAPALDELDQYLNGTKTASSI